VEFDLDELSGVARTGRWPHRHVVERAGKWVFYSNAPNLTDWAKQLKETKPAILVLISVAGSARSTRAGAGRRPLST
jgi:hypothetical protein